VVGADDVLGRCLMQLDLTIEPLCSSLELFGHRGMHCQGRVDATGSSVMGNIYIPMDQPFWEGVHGWVGKGPYCGGHRTL
jgi:hypothetical protein